MSSFRWLLIVIAPLCALAVILSARPQQDTVRVDVRLVNVYATVIDSSGRYVPRLKAADFQVYEDGKRQTLANFGQDEETPVSVGIVFDKSGSMFSKLRTATDAVSRFVAGVHADDDIFLLAFDNQAHLLEDFTSDRVKLNKALRSIDAGGGTALYDALMDSLDRVRHGRYPKRAILLITDGQDTDSQTSFYQVRASLRTSELLVYALGISPNSVKDPYVYGVPASPGASGPFGGRDSVDMGVLQTFALDSGGRAFLIGENMMRGKTNQFQTILAQIAEELRSQYTLAYYPTHGDDGKYHTIHVTTRYGYQVRARQGYIAAEKPALKFH